MPDKIHDTVETRSNDGASQQNPPNSPPPLINGNEDYKSENGEGGGAKVIANEDEPPHWTRYVEAVCAILLVLITGTYTYYASSQADASVKAANAAKSAADTASQTLKEMRTGSGATDTHTLAVQAQTQALQTTALATAAGKQATQTEKLASDALIQAKAANTLAVQAQRSADYAQQAIQTSIESDRPWVGVVSFSIENHVEGQTAKAHFVIQNTGKRPATVSIIGARAEFISFPLAPFADNKGARSTNFILPGATANSIASYELSEGTAVRLKKEKKTEFFYAELIYSDPETNSTYITHYCAYFDASNADIPYPFCTRYNEAK